MRAPVPDPPRRSSGRPVGPGNRRPDPVLQRGSIDLVGGAGLPRHAARRHDLCLRQQLQGPHGRTGARSRRRGPHRTAPGQGQCGPPDVRGYRGRRLCAGRWRRHLPRPQRAAADLQAGVRTARHGQRRAGDRDRRGLPPRPPLRQHDADRHRGEDLRQPGRRHAVRLPGLLAPVRQELPGAERRVRDRDGTDRPCAGTAHADVRRRDALQGPPARLRQQAADLLRRLPHPEADPGAGEGGTPAPVLQPAVGARWPSSPWCWRGRCW